MAKAVFQKVMTGVGPALVPTDDDGRDILAAWKSDRQCLLDIHTPRNPRHHRMIFLLMKRCIDGGAWEAGTDSLLDWIKFATGHVRTAVDHNGRAHYAPASIAFASMDQSSFVQFFDRAVHAVCSRLLGDDDWEKVRDEIIEIVDGRYIAQANHLRRVK
ncbi:DUF1367 family protein [Nitratireductor sp. StC3]|uniref:DUF1367 family protein n=1 Tax=Nitratireductor sp. StC3 TaxID=2126741 RepID=UPI000D0D55D4|nr:DUF1367 family protein [Nitratireductor sp. StC3]PSM18255.1 hypothetical protein C7T96_10325 [Nitratireductor sp. StC3]